MEYIDLADSGLKASRIGLSTCTMSLGILNQTQRQSSKETIIEALNKGINLIDIGLTGDCSLVEEMIGRVISEYGNRANVIIVAKTRMGEIRNDSGLIDPDRISRVLEDSLKRLRTDYIDIYEISQAAQSVYFPEIVRKIERFMKEGKVRMVGVDNQPCEIIQIPGGIPAIHVAQFPYNMFEREAESEIIPFVQKKKIVAVTSRSLCSGLLAGGIKKDTMFKPDDLRLYDPLFLPGNLSHNLAAVEELDSLAMEHFSRKVIHLSVRWLLDRLNNSIVLWGAGKPEYLNPVDEAMGWHIDSDTFEMIEEILARAAGKNGKQVLCNSQSREE